MNSQQCIKFYIRNYGSYYDFLVSGALGIYETLREGGGLGDKNCEIWYDGQYVEMLQLFSRMPIHTGEPPCDAMPPVPIRPARTKEWKRLLPFAEFVSSHYNCEAEAPGISVIKRTNRRYMDHDALIGILRERGFCVRDAFLEQMSLREQIQLMKNTRLLIGPHGAGLVNMVFMPPDSTVVELLPRAVDCNAFPATALASGHHYIEIESPYASHTSRVPPPAVEVFLSTKGWPTREDSRGWPSLELQRFVRRVDAFSIVPATIIEELDRKGEFERLGLC